MHNAHNAVAKCTSCNCKPQTISCTRWSLAIAKYCQVVLHYRQVSKVRTITKVSCTMYILYITQDVSQNIVFYIAFGWECLPQEQLEAPLAPPILSTPTQLQAMPFFPSYSWRTRPTTASTYSTSRKQRLSMHFVVVSISTTSSNHDTFLLQVILVW